MVDRMIERVNSFNNSDSSSSQAVRRRGEKAVSKAVSMLSLLSPSASTPPPSRSRCCAKAAPTTIYKAGRGSRSRAPRRSPKSSRRTSAEARLRVFAELAAAPLDDDGDGDGANGGAPTPPPAAATFVLDFYRAGQAPGLAAVLKGGKAADTAVLYRVARNVITHAWLAPDRDGLAEKGEAVGEAVGEAECLRGLQADRRDARCARRVLRRREAAGALLLQLIDCADMRSDMPPTVG